jgi:uncharacterized membrane protein YccC
LSYLKAYKSFINGRYLSEGIRITAGILFPALVMSYFNLLPTGIVMSVGALCVSATDSPGPVQHRVNGMLLCNLVIGLVTIVVGYSTVSGALVCTVIFVFGFLFSMLTVYGTRTSAVGIAALLVMILNLQTTIHGINIWTNALYILAGGTWYMLFSLALYKIRPYKLIRQISGDFIQSIAAYLQTSGSFYGQDPDYNNIQQLLLQQQVNVQAQQNLLSELLFKTRAIVKESTHTGRVLLKIYLDVADLFESIVTTYSEFNILHKVFDETGIMDEFRLHILSLSDELEEMGLAVKSGFRSYGTQDNLKKIKQTREHFETMRLNYMTDENIENFISLGRILQNIEELAENIHVLHGYTSYEKKIKRGSGFAELKNYQNYAASTGFAELKNYQNYGYNSYAETTDIRPSLFINNLNLDSNIFRHSLRVSLAFVIGYLSSLFFHIGHSYWILLTIVVILKPAYSLTKKRNTDRLIGTFLGVIIGVLILLLIKNNIALLFVMIFFMATSYVFLRTSYFTSVLFMTPYLVIFFHLLYPGNLRMVLTDRVLDTAIGSGISFLASIFFVPQWEHTTIKMVMVQMLESNKQYYTILAKAFSSTRPLEPHELNKTRRDVLVALANLSDAFTRMLSEPKRFQKGMEAIHQFVVLNHTLTSHLSTLSYYLNVRKNNFRSADLLPVIENTEQYFSNAIDYLQERKNTTVKADKSSLIKLNELADRLLEKRKKEISLGQFETETKIALVNVKSVIDQFNYIFRIAADIYKSSKKIQVASS